MQLKSLKLCKSVLPKDIKMPTATLAYPQYTHHAVAGIDPRNLLTFCQELHALARTATLTALASRASLASYTQTLSRSVNTGRLSTEIQEL